MFRRVSAAARLALALLAAPAAGLPAGPHATSPLTRERTLVVTRHGIRMPFPPFDGAPVEIFSKDKGRDFVTEPARWGAAKIAALTSHGKEVIRLMGAHFGEAVLPPPPYNFTVYADLDHTDRDIQTAENFMAGAYPAANFSVDPWDVAHPDYMRWLMNQGNSSRAECPTSGHLPEVVKAEIGGSFAAVSVEQEVAISRLGGALDCCQPQVCAFDPGGSRTARPGETPSRNSTDCTLMDLKTKWMGTRAYWKDFSGPLSTASALIEYIQLMYLNGLDWQQPVKGSTGEGSKTSPPLTYAELRSLMRMHEETMAIADDYWNAVRGPLPTLTLTLTMAIADDYWNAEHAGSELLVHLAATLEQFVSPATPIGGLRSHPTDRLIYYAAHDINIYFLRRLLDLNWLTESFNPNESPPGGFLTLELYSSSTHAGGIHSVGGVGGGGGGGGVSYYVKAYFMSQSYDQQREARPLSASDPAARAFAMIPSCADGPELSCPFEDFKRLVLQRARAECVQLVDMSVLRPRPRR